MATKYAKYFAIEKRLKAMPGFDIERSEMIEEFTSGKKSSLKDLTETEYREFCTSIQKLINNPQPSKADWQNTPANIMRRKIIGLCVKMGWVNGSKADLQRIQSWVLKYGYLKKELNTYTESELPKLVSQAEMMYADFLKTY